MFQAPRGVLFVRAFQVGSMGNHTLVGRNPDLETMVETIVWLLVPASSSVPEFMNVKLFGTTILVANEKVRAFFWPSTRQVSHQTPKFLAATSEGRNRSPNRRPPLPACPS